MKIYAITHDKFSYDSYGGHVIVSKSEDQVIQLAKDKSATEGEGVWDSAMIENCGDYTGERTDPFILLSDFRAG